jgi:DNA-directed RNA polymerase alpha subunit
MFLSGLLHFSPGLQTTFNRLTFRSCRSHYASQGREQVMSTAPKASAPDADSITVTRDHPNVVAALRLSPRTRNSLVGSGIYFTTELLGKRERDLLRLPGIGRVAIEEIQAALGEYGLGLPN